MAKKKDKTLSVKSQAALEQKRRAATVLKKAGLYKPKTKLSPEKLLKSSYFRKLQRQYADVISGETRAAKLPKTQTALFKNRGYRIKNGRVIVPRAVKRVTREVALNPPPDAPRPGHSFRRCLNDVIAWLRDNHDPKFGDIEERIETLRDLASQYPDIFRAIVNATHMEGENYLAGRPPIRNLWPEGIEADMFRALFYEIYYYKPSDAMHNIPRC